MTRTTAVLYHSLAALVLMAAATPALDASSAPRWWEGKFILSSFSSVRPGDDMEAVVARLADLGLHAFESNTPLQYKAETLSPAEQRAVLEAAGKHGLKYFITDHTRLTGVGSPTRAAIESLVRDYKQFPALGGYYLWDEPHVSNFPAVKTAQEILLELDPDRLPLTAMLPSYGPYRYPYLYPGFVRQWNHQVDPPVLSFDFYGVLQDPEREEGRVVVVDQLYRDLALWSEVAQQSGKPLWFYAAVSQRAPLARPTRATVGFQAYAAIAHGAKGIQWFSVRGFEGGSVDFVNAPLSADGTPGASYELLKSVNAELRALAPDFERMTAPRVRFTGPIPAHTSGFERGFGGIASISGNLIVSVHDDRETGRRDAYLLVVSRDLHAEQEVNIEFQPGRGAVVDGSTIERLQFALAPGGGRLLRLGSRQGSLTSPS
jgi:hypothetical protein